jgi:phytoene dehydrogenase-like protein
MIVQNQASAGSGSAPVIIVGGGLSGLNCAKNLHKAGLPFVLLEADTWLGGRVQTKVQAGFRLDRGFQVLLDSYPAAQAHLDLERLQLGRFLPGALIRFRNRFAIFSDPFRSPRYLLQTAVSPVATLFDKLRMFKFRAFATHNDSKRFAQLRETTTADYLRSLGFSPQVIGAFFKPFFGGVFLESELLTSNRKFLELFRYFSQGHAGLPAAGMSAIPAQLAEGLPPTALRTNSRVTKISANQVLLESGEAIPGQHIVLACDPWQTARLLNEPPPPRGHMTTVMYFTADRSPLSRPWLVLNGDEPGPINSLCIPSDVAKDYAPPQKSLISVTLKTSFANPSIDGDLLTEVRLQLRRWYGAQVDAWIHLDTISVLNALPVQNNFDPNGDQCGIRQVDNLVVCGDYLDIASIQGAMQSGSLAAERIISGSC